MTTTREIGWHVQRGLGVFAVVALATGCCKQLQSEESETKPANSITSEITSIDAGGAGKEVKEDPGPMVTIPAGVLLAGTPCQKVPRITNEELKGINIQMGEFTMDAYPYPNDPSKPPMVNISRDQAETLCKSRGRRLCTELEWERACKGPGNTTYPYGDSFMANRCKGDISFLRQVSHYDECGSAFGVKALYGVVWEWTASEWARGGTGATVRGGGHTNGSVRHRCANGQSRSASEVSADLGFRCCGGLTNPATVQLSLDKRSPIEMDASVDPALASRLMANLPANMRTIEGFVTSIDQIWRWHPRDNEEMIVARYRARQQAGTGQFFHPIVFHICENAVVRSAKLRGPVARMLNPTVGTNPQQLTISLETGQDKGDAVFTYHYGNVGLTQPTWIKEGNRIELEEEGRRRIPNLRLPVKVRTTN
jgi:formylglycine-generating enzyme required for sulfatase activity